MADDFLSLLDISKMNLNDQAVGLIQEVNTVAPETELMGRPINGITYTSLVQTGNTATPIFRSANEGVAISHGKYDQKVSGCNFIDAQLQIDEAVISAGKGEGASQAAIMALEAATVVRQKAIALGDQFYRGTTADAKGHQGLQQFYDSTNAEVAAGASTNTTSAWLIWNHLQGVHWIFGNNAGLTLSEWSRQQVTRAANQWLYAYCANLSGYVGLGFGHKLSVVRIKTIKNVASGSAGWLTDALVAEALTKMPIFMRRQPGLRLLMNSTAAFTLQKSRSTVVVEGSATKKTDSGILQFAPTPVESNGVPIIITDSIPQTEA